MDYEVYPASVTETNVAFVTLHRQFDLQGIHTLSHSCINRNHRFLVYLHVNLPPTSYTIK